MIMKNQSSPYVLGKILSLTLILLVAIALNGVSQDPDPRMNILLIISEDNSANLGCYGDAYARTPNLDKLASQGVRFDNAYVTQSVCSPSRGTIFTGLYPHQNGQIGLATHQYAMFRDWGTSYKYMKSAGYTTGLIGKTHINPKEYVEDHVDMRFQESSNFKKEDLESYWKEAGVFMKEAGSPFFLTVNFPDAHWPLQDQVEGMPENPQSVDEIGTLPFIGVESPDIMKSLTGYYNSMQRLDESVGKLMSELESSGKADNTVVVYMSDHGAQMARGKITPLEGGMKIPMIMRWPGVTKANTTNDALWSTIDLLPTLLEISGQQKPGYLPGKSVKPLLEKKESASEYREHLFTQRNCDGVIFYFPQRTVRDDRYKLIWSPIQDRPNNAAELYLEHRFSAYFGSPTREELLDAPEEIQKAYKTWEFPPIYQLYDLKADPWEFKNLAEDGVYQDIKESLINTLQSWQVKTNDPLAEPYLLQELTKEHDLLAGTDQRSTPGGWKYLDYLHPEKREATSLETFKKFNADRYNGITYTTICKIGKTYIANADDSRYTGIREPNAVITDKGTLVVVFGPHDQEAVNDRAHQDLICRTSMDNGKSWSEARLIMDVGMESLLPTTLIYDRESSQLVLLVNQIFNAPERKDPLGLKEPNKHFVLFSDDEGKTWSEPKPILEDEPGICVFGGGHGIQLKHGSNAGRLLAPGGIGPNGAKPGVFYSDDHGKSWQFSEVRGEGNTEATGCELKDGSLLFSWREQKNQFGVRTCRSDDGGLTTDQRTMSLPDVWAGCNNSLLNVTVDEKSAVLYVGPLGPENASKYALEHQADKLKTGSEDSYQVARSNGGAFISLDNGKTWQGRCIAPDWVFGYNAAVQFPDGDIGVIFEGIPPGTENVENKGWDKKQLGIYLAKFRPELL